LQRRSAAADLESKLLSCCPMHGRLRRGPRPTLSQQKTFRETSAFAARGGGICKPTGNIKGRIQSSCVLAKVGTQRRLDMFRSGRRAGAVSRGDTFAPAPLPPLRACIHCGHARGCPARFGGAAPAAQLQHRQAPPPNPPNHKHTHTHTPISPIQTGCHEAGPQEGMGVQQQQGTWVDTAGQYAAVVKSSP
jgi:hypothetical protein